MLIPHKPRSVVVDIQDLNDDAGRAGVRGNSLVCGQDHEAVSVLGLSVQGQVGLDGASVSVYGEEVASPRGVVIGEVVEHFLVDALVVVLGRDDADKSIFSRPLEDAEDIGHVGEVGRHVVHVEEGDVHLTGAGQGRGAGIWIREGERV